MHEHKSANLAIQHGLQHCISVLMHLFSYWSCLIVRHAPNMYLYLSMTERLGLGNFQVFLT